MPGEGVVEPVFEYETENWPISNTYWIHGLNTHVESPHMVQRAGPIMSTTDDGRTTRLSYEIEQSDGENWFHLAIPTKTDTTLMRAEIDGVVNKSAKLISARIFHGIYQLKEFAIDPPIQGDRFILRYDAYSYSFKRWPLPPHMHQDGDFPGKKLDAGGIVMSILASFKPGGKIKIYGAGADFEE